MNINMVSKQVKNEATSLPVVVRGSTENVACLSFLRSFSTCVFETRTATGSDLFSPSTCLHTTTITLLSIISPLEMISISIKIWEPPLSWHAKWSLPVAARVSKKRVLNKQQIDNRREITKGTFRELVTRQKE